MEQTGQQLIDDEVLAGVGVTDLSRYQQGDGSDLLPDIFWTEAARAAGHEGSAGRSQDQRARINGSTSDANWVSARSWSPPGKWNTSSSKPELDVEPRSARRARPGRR